MGKKPSLEKKEGTARLPSNEDDVAALRSMSREDRIAVLMKGLDAACGPLPPKRGPFARTMPVKTCKKG
jgi:hypothetical protein